MCIRYAVCPDAGTELPAPIRLIFRHRWPLNVARLDMKNWMCGLAGDTSERAADSASRGVASLSRIAYFLIPEMNEGAATRERAKSKFS